MILVFNSPLHSTMFLLILLLSTDREKHIHNFTFHYVSINTGKKQCTTLRFQTLHSTMFLLIPPPQVYNLIILLNFTFHYVSINTLLWKSTSADLRNFTFHYVSINTKLAFHIFQHQKSLHSTMFLLIRMWQVSHWLTDLQLYIPLCFY